MRLPLLLSVPHAGLTVPPEVGGLCRLDSDDIISDSDGGAAGIYFPLKAHVAAFLTTDIARAIVDLNRAEDDRRKDGVVKTHTSWNVPIYRKPLPEENIEQLLEKYHRPYHRRLDQLAGNVMIGIDCHTMAAVGPPVGPDPGRPRPPVCLSNADGTCPQAWLATLAEVIEAVLESTVSLNAPFKGGFITRRRPGGIDWLQIEFSRAPFLSDEEKGSRLLDALKQWIKNIL